MSAPHALRHMLSVGRESVEAGVALGGEIYRVDFGHSSGGGGGGNERRSARWQWHLANWCAIVSPTGTDSHIGWRVSLEEQPQAADGQPARGERPPTECCGRRTARLGLSSGGHALLKGARAAFPVRHDLSAGAFCLSLDAYKLTR